MAYIAGLATSLPAHDLSQTTAFEHALSCGDYTKVDSKVLGRLYRRTAISKRSIVLCNESSGVGIEKFYPAPCNDGDLGPSTNQRMKRYEEEIIPLAMPAAKAAIVESRIDVASIAQLITVSCTGFFAPGLDLALIHQLGLNPGIGRTHIGFMGCHASLNALRVASAFCASSNAPVLICAAELCSLHFQYGWDANKLLSNALFSDGAAALILDNQSSDKDSWKMVASGSVVIPDSADAMTWTIGDNGFSMTLSSEIPDLISKHLFSWLQSWLRPHNLSISDINCWAIHPGGPRILDSVQDALSLSDEVMAPSRTVFAECGNMSSPTVLFILKQLKDLQRKPPCVMLAFGPDCPSKPPYYSSPQ